MVVVCRRNLWGARPLAAGARRRGRGTEAELTEEAFSFSPHGGEVFDQRPPGVRRLLPAPPPGARPLGQRVAQSSQTVAQSVRVVVEVGEAAELFFDEGFLFEDGGGWFVGNADPEGGEEAGGEE